MKKTILFLSFLFIFGSSTFAQRFGYVDTEYILRHIPEYVSAQKKLDQQAEVWRKEIDQKYAEVDKLYKEYQADQVLLTPEMKQQREQEIVGVEKRVKDMEREKFGYRGSLFEMRQELVKPIQDKVYEAVEKVAVSGSLSFIFDKNSDLIMLYANDRYDKSDDVVTQLGLTPGKFADVETTQKK